MGREIKRVAEGFDWPLKKVWAGYDNPYWNLRRDCPECCTNGRRGFSPYAGRLYDLWYGDAPFRPEDNGSAAWLPSDPFIDHVIRLKVMHSPASWFEMYKCEDIDQVVLLESIRMCEHYNKAWQYHLSDQDILDLVEADCLWDFTRRPLNPDQETWPNGWTQEPNGYLPSREEVLKWHMSPGFSGMAGSETYAIIRARCQREGQPLECERCGGNGDIWESQAAKRLYDEWEETEPPEGEWWQVWETVSEGSPYSPPFATAEELINWLVQEEGYSDGAAESFVLGSGWVPSLAMVNGRLYKDIETTNMPQDGDDETPDFDNLLEYLEEDHIEPGEPVEIAQETAVEPAYNLMPLYTAVGGIAIFFVLIMLMAG